MLQTEIEAKFLDVDHEALRTQLRNIGATLVQPMRAMRRTHYDLPGLPLQAKNSFIRLRDEGDKATLSYKQVQDLSVEGTKEVCVVVNSYDKTASLLQAAGLVARSYHETHRESWTYKGAEIELDEWPAIAPIAEIEAADEKTLWDIAQELLLDDHETLHGTADYLSAYFFDVTTDEVNEWPEITFADTPLQLAGRERAIHRVVGASA